MSTFDSTKYYYDSNYYGSKGKIKADERAKELRKQGYKEVIVAKVPNAWGVFRNKRKSYSRKR